MARSYKASAVRKGQIINAAKRLIIKYGSEHVTVRRMAREVGLSEAAIYRHFKSKSDVLSFMVDNVDESLAESISQVPSGGNSSLETLGKLLRSHISSIEQRRGISFQIIAEIISLGNKKLNQKVVAAINKYLLNLKKLLESGVRSGEVSKDMDLEAASLLLFSMIQGLVNLWALAGYGFDLEKEYDSLWMLYRRSLNSGEQPFPEKS
jgi:AcrR family transcriptional regulator